MKTLMKLFAILGLSLIPLASADFPGTQKQFIQNDGKQNLLDNPGFEFGTHNWNLAGVASTFSVTTNASTVAVGGRSGEFAGGAGEHLDSDLFVIPNLLKGRPCMARLAYQSSTGDVGFYKLKVLDHGDAELVSLDLHASTLWQQDVMPFTCPSVGSVKLRVTGNDASAPTIYLDNAHVGGTVPGDLSSNDAPTYQMYMAYFQDTVADPVKTWGDWIDNANTTEASPGVRVIAFKTGTFSEPPFCFCTVGNMNTSSRGCGIIADSPSATQVEINIDTFGSAAVDSEMMLMCIGKP